MLFAASKCSYSQALHQFKVVKVCERGYCENTCGVIAVLKDRLYIKIGKEQCADIRIVKRDETKNCIIYRLFLKDVYHGFFIVYKTNPPKLVFSFFAVGHPAELFITYYVKDQ
jgi:hypothetical protein